MDFSNSVCGLKKKKKFKDYSLVTPKARWNFRTLWLFDSMTNFYFKTCSTVVHIWYRDFEWNQPWLSDSEVCPGENQFFPGSQTCVGHRSSARSLMPFQWPCFINYLGQNEFALCSPEIRTPSESYSMSLPNALAKSLLPGVGNLSNSEESAVDHLERLEKSLGKPWD